MAGVEAIQAPGHYHPVQFCQWLFGAQPHHPVLGRVLDLVVYRCATKFQVTDLCRVAGSPMSRYSVIVLQAVVLLRLAGAHPVYFHAVAGREKSGLV